MNGDDLDIKVNTPENIDAPEQRKADVFSWAKRQFGVPRGIAKSRLAICQTCDKYNNQTRMCSVCKCLMPAKVMLPRSSCPEKKWGKLNKDTDKVVKAALAKIKQNKTKPE